MLIQNISTLNSDNKKLTFELSSLSKIILEYIYPKVCDFLCNIKATTKQYKEKHIKMALSLLMNASLDPKIKYVVIYKIGVYIIKISTINALTLSINSIFSNIRNKLHITPTTWFYSFIPILAHRTFSWYIHIELKIF